MTIGNGTRRSLRVRCAIAATVAAAAVLLAPGLSTWSTSGAETMGVAQRAEPPFTFAARKLGPALRRRITGVSWHRGCPVARARLRYLRIAYHGFGGRVRIGEMIAKRSGVRPLERAFPSLYRSRFPIRRMRLVDDYGGSDYR